MKSLDATHTHHIIRQVDSWVNHKHKEINYLLGATCILRCLCFNTDQQDLGEVLNGELTPDNLL